MNYFKISEFDSPDIPGSGVNMKLRFLNKLSKARQIAQIPFVINSGYRSINHNRIVNGRDDSAHLTGQAADIYCITSSNRYIIISSLLLSGITRIGIYPNFIHADTDQDKPQDVIWHGK